VIMLYIVSTPIGNLQDMTFRAVEVLKSVDLIASEDTRHTGILLKHFGIQTPQTSYFEHSKNNKEEYLIGLLKEGKSVALVSDAGTPAISDPGYRLVRAAREQGIEVTAVPGACAAVVALSLSGFPTDRFVFEGFLPQKSSGRVRRLTELKSEERTIVLYESPHRLVKALGDIAEVMGNPRVMVGRELTKKFEEVRQGDARSVSEHFMSRKPKGEVVILISQREELFHQD